jgi:hypothetical protein
MQTSSHSEARARNRRPAHGRPPRLLGLRRHQASDLVTETEPRYLDEDGDGVLDAVEITVTLVAVGDDFRRVLSTTRLLLAQVDDEGVPHHISARPAA